MKKLIILIFCMIAYCAYLPVGHAQAHHFSAVNNDLSQSLQQHQAYANTDPGNYGYAKYIQQIKYCGKDQINVTVTAHFNEMRQQDRLQILNQVQALAKMVLQQDRQISNHQAKKGLRVTIKSPNATIGKSLPNNHYHYRWK